MSGFRRLLSRLLGRRREPPTTPAPQPPAAPAPASQPHAPPAPTPEQVPASDGASASPSLPQTPSPEVARRAERAAERALSNESLTADLDDRGAQTLIDWTLARTQAIADATAGMDEAAAQIAMAPRLQALERMARLIDRWATSGREDLLQPIATQAEIVYGTSLQVPQIAVMASDEPAVTIRRLRAAIEGQVTGAGPTIEA